MDVTATARADPDDTRSTALTGLLRRALRRLDDYTVTALNPVFIPLGRYYQALARRSPQG